MLDTLIEGAQVVLPQGTFQTGLGIQDGRIAFIGDDPPKARTRLKADQLVLLPGAVDLHVHFSEPGRGHWEGWAHGSRAALAGGVTTVVDMPLNAVPATVNPDAFALKRGLGEQKSVVDFALWGGLIDDNLSELGALHRCGVTGFKAFMLDTADASFPYVPDGLLIDGMQQIAALDAVLAVHAENTALIAHRTARLRAAGQDDARAWLTAHDELQELDAVRRALLFARHSGCDLHLVHLSTPEAVDAVLNAQRDAQAVTSEVCAHHLLLTDQDFVQGGAEFKCAPPLRSRQATDGLWEQVLAGQVNVLASDHSPCPGEDKAVSDIWRAWGGINGVQVLLPLLLSEGVLARGLPLHELARMLCHAPAVRAGIAHRKGSLKVGLDADLVLASLRAPWTLRADDLQSRHPHSAYVGHRFGAQVLSVYQRGVQTVSNGRLTRETLRMGEWLPPVKAPASAGIR
ncbi:allantoinase AllB [Deinococcus aquiradiocola]|uniref:Allantoinase n=1 Tax=Deinococcus aquiradiocola TaxID=393059 RepID=A0A917P8W4_9DEIO|nr:allantoinase AllB [Deinococcus aquiradiocola]GGJ67100.1 allantoinase [Deinococcus aquiradiocola]